MAEQVAAVFLGSARVPGHRRDPVLGRGEGADRDLPPRRRLRLQGRVAREGAQQEAHAQRAVRLLHLGWRFQHGVPQRCYPRHSASGLHARFRRGHDPHRLLLHGLRPRRPRPLRPDGQGGPIVVGVPRHVRAALSSGAHLQGHAPPLGVAVARLLGEGRARLLRAGAHPVLPRPPVPSGLADLQPRLHPGLRQEAAVRARQLGA
mmetsp:Transcript_16078/g.32694  ORF Transcript_16078/g.32694 Transcript_16078/m.32694 type:complete len:205 (-) Transcript_16078:163-777(-)